ncbi:UDP-N-acetylmuramoyl-L-alanine--D-glutamate ligase [Blochmannia endosymbiont of Colobopsis nipponica]|uniref:UDP-N-acetylmuramoyl-L-alanine--D-glutamate ligase n=1 Tax=Blochmannia endosymbiont of Colobopsis nipponica TaxID=2681987 RepID=UPI00178235A3|nr:UDP-N-acetylmuramoyl-L-alanine--D-glutamate ligase [Blochmannia endosymbiont of Colobopsis nipponica]QOI11268.1 UDP-N-acetylmuramoyl-L-alanine--D-glutamate ligase [Blochmannia endosymbiont of Colobopsis nipponica]
MMNYQGKRVVVIGLGITGLSCIAFFLKRNVIPQVMDTRKYPPNLDKLPDNIEYCLGELNRQWLFKATLIVLSPGISLYHPLLIMAANLGIEIVGDIELFLREVTKPIIAITGTNGKSTVTKLVGEFVKGAGLRVGIGGNIGIPVLTLLDFDYQLYVLEISSFQLETIYTLHAAAATVLNISDEHVNRYPYGLHQYQKIKLKIYQSASLCIVNALDLLTFPRGKNNCFSRFVYFGVKYSNFYLDYYKKQIFLILHNKILLNCLDLKIVGYHNYLNILAALALVDFLSISHFVYWDVLRKFTGLPHRFELVHFKNGVRWINDSKSTNMASTRAALMSLSFDRGVIHLLLGGDAKSADFNSFKSYVQGDRIFLYCFGKDAKYLAKLRSDHVVITDTMEQALKIISIRACYGDVVLLSPGCSSLDQFENFEVRGERFTNLAKKFG